MLLLPFLAKTHSNQKHNILEDECHLTIEVKPSDGILQAQITNKQLELKAKDKRKAKQYDYHIVEGSIERINRYGDQSHCAGELVHEHKLYCYCTDLLNS